MFQVLQFVQQLLQTLETGMLKAGLESEYSPSFGEHFPDSESMLVPNTSIRLK
jgi:hypothetical protein